MAKHGFEILDSDMPGPRGGHNDWMYDFCAADTSRLVGVG
jgi:hypothetical protein